MRSARSASISPIEAVRHGDTATSNPDVGQGALLPGYSRVLSRREHGCHASYLRNDFLESRIARRTFAITSAIRNIRRVVLASGPLEGRGIGPVRPKVFLSLHSGASQDRVPDGEARARRIDPGGRRNGDDEDA